MRSFTADDRVCAQTPLVPHRSPREGTGMVPYCEGAQWVVLGLERDTWPLDEVGYWQYVRETLARTDLGVADWQEDFVFLRQGADPSRNAATWQAIMVRYQERVGAAGIR
jgi:hypothetical protein